MTAGFDGSGGSGSVPTGFHGCRGWASAQVGRRRPRLAAKQQGVDENEDEDDRHQPPLTHSPFWRPWRLGGSIPPLRLGGDAIAPPLGDRQECLSHLQSIDYAGRLTILDGGCHYPIDRPGIRGNALDAGHPFQGPSGRKIYPEGLTRSPSSWLRSTTVPLLPTTARKTSPTGLAGVPPPGPAMPVVATVTLTLRHEATIAFSVMFCRFPICASSTRGPDGDA